MTMVGAASGRGPIMRYSSRVGGSSRTSCRKSGGERRGRCSRMNGFTIRRSSAKLCSTASLEIELRLRRAHNGRAALPRSPPSRPWPRKLSPWAKWPCAMTRLICSSGRALIHTVCVRRSRSAYVSGYENDAARRGDDRRNWCPATTRSSASRSWRRKVAMPAISIKLGTLHFVLLRRHGGGV